MRTNPMVAAALLVAGCAGGATRPAEQSVEPAPAEICVAVMKRTRGCAEVYVPGLLALRVRLDRPAGIAARFAADGEQAMVALAHEQFAEDWSEEAIARNCEGLGKKPKADQERIVAPDRRCLQEADCRTFTACDLAQKEQRWTKAP